LGADISFFLIGALFFMVVNQAFGMLGPVLSSFDTERQVFFLKKSQRKNKKTQRKKLGFWMLGPVLSSFDTERQVLN